jgi:serine/threonine-protein phosphatase 6 regulatory ankyrin repeat subunit B
LKNNLVAEIVNKTRESESASQTVIIGLFRQVVRMIPNCTLVIDGLDECVPDSSCLSVADFIKEVNEAVRDTDTKILVMSRPENSIRQALKEVKSAKFSEHGVRKDDVRSDIEALSKVIVAEKLRDQGEAIQVEMTKKMSDQSKGQFLWLRLQQDSLSEGLSQKELQDAIDKMPADLPVLYSRNWSIISQGKDMDRSRVMLLLRLAVFSLRSLTVREICEAIFVSDEFRDFPVHELLDHLDEKSFKEKILNLCCSFLEARPQSLKSPFEKWTIHPVHFSVKEFYLRVIMQQSSVLLQSDSLSIAAEHNLLAELCIKYMNDPYARQISRDDGTTSSNSFTYYAAKFWNKHAEAAITQQKNALIEKLFDEDGASWVVWRNWFDSNKRDWANTKSDRDPAIPLCYAIELGYTDLAMEIIEKGETRVNHSSSSRTALGVACSKGYDDLARKLLARGAKVGSRDVHGRTAVYYAAMNGHSELVKLLVDNGANINLQDYNGVSPFLAASTNGHLNVMRQLIQKGADIHQLDKDGNCALFKASSNNHLYAARALIVKGVHRQLSKYTTPPIFVALKNDSSHLARLLIKKEIDVNITSGIEELTILHVAISEGKTDIAKLLIDRGADITLQNANGQTPFYVACLYGHIRIVELLIENKVDMTPDKGGKTPFFVACLHGHIEIVKLLIDKEADNIKTADNEGKTPLYVACANRQVDIARLLIKHDADIEGDIPLLEAAFGGSIEIVEILTERAKKATDVSINIRNGALLAACEGGFVNILERLIKWIGDEILNMDYEWTIDNTSTKCNVMNAALLLASGTGHAGVIDLLLKKGANYDYSDPHSQTPLYGACCNGHLEVAKLLIEKGADIKATEEKGQTPLMAACANGNLDLIKLLLEKGADIEIGAASAAARNGQLEVLRLLLSKDADILRRDQGDLLLTHVASQNSHPRTVNYLIDNGSDATVVDADGKTPLWLASSDGKVDVVNVLLKHGADVDAIDSAGQTPLMIASFRGYAKTVRLLIDNCAHICIKDKMGQTPLYCASASGHFGVVKLLLDHGADMTPNKEGQTPAYAASSNGHVDVLRLLIESGADVINGDVQGHTLLHTSCYFGRIKTTKLLLEMGASINSYNEEGFSPLYSASKKEHLAIVECLISKGADSFKQESGGWSLITAASSKDHKKTVKFLIEQHKVDAESPDGNGITPLIAACEAGHIRTARYLIKRKVDVNRAANNTTPLQAAQSNRHTEVVELLLQNGAVDKGREGKNGMPPANAAVERVHSQMPKLMDSKNQNKNHRVAKKAI